MFGGGSDLAAISVRLNDDQIFEAIVKAERDKGKVGTDLSLAVMQAMFHHQRTTERKVDELRSTLQRGLIGILLASGTGSAFGPDVVNLVANLWR